MSNEKELKAFLTSKNESCPRTLGTLIIGFAIIGDRERCRDYSRAAEAYMRFSPGHKGEKTGKLVNEIA